MNLFGNVGGGQRRRIAGEHDHVLDRVTKLTHISRPGVSHQHATRLGGNALDLRPVPRIRHVQEVFDQQRNILTPLTQRGNQHCRALDPEVEVLAKFFVGHLLLQVAVGRRNNADIDLHRFVGADANDFTIFQHAQQFRLHGQGHIAHFVQEQRTAAGVFEPPCSFARSASVGALDVAKQFVFQ